VGGLSQRRQSRSSALDSGCRPLQQRTAQPCPLRSRHWLGRGSGGGFAVAARAQVESTRPPPGRGHGGAHLVGSGLLQQTARLIAAPVAGRPAWPAGAEEGVRMPALLELIPVPRNRVAGFKRCSQGLQSTSWGSARRARRG